MEKLQLPRVALTMFDGAGEARAARAVNIATTGIDYAEVVYISPSRPSGLECDYRFVQIPRFDYATAMRFQARTMGELCHHDFQLSIEWDGFPINPHLWEDEFMEWDYIGAPWPPSIVKNSSVSTVGNAAGASG